MSQNNPFGTGVRLYNFSHHWLQYMKPTIHKGDTDQSTIWPISYREKKIKRKIDSKPTIPIERKLTKQTQLSVNHC